MATIVTSSDLALALKAAPLSYAQIAALDSNSALCARPAIAVGVLRGEGYQLTVTSDAKGNPLFQVAA
ncbi:hypothetical protein [Burkholderia phage vB_BglM_WTB]